MKLPVLVSRFWYVQAPGLDKAQNDLLDKINEYSGLS